MSDKEFTIPVVQDPAFLAKLNDIEEEVIANQETIMELKKIKTGTGLSISVDLDEVTE